MLRELAATPAEIAAIINVLGPRGRDGGLREGQKLRLLFSPTDGGQRQKREEKRALHRRAGMAIVSMYAK